MFHFLCNACLRAFSFHNSFFTDTAFSRIEIVSNAMDLRGFGRYKKRTWYVREPYTKADMIALAAGIAFLLLGICLKAASSGYFWYPFNCVGCTMI
jgi:hypothetical protein